MKKRNKGEYGYIKWMKLSRLLCTVGMVFIGLFVFAVGYYLNHTTANLFTVMAILAVLPGARYLTGLIVFLPYQTIEEERYERLKRYERDGNVLLVDLVLTSNEKVMNLDALILTDRKAFGLAGKKGQDLPYIKDYLSKHFGRYVDGYEVRILEDEMQYFDLLEGDAIKSFEETAEMNEMVRDVLTLVVS